MATYTLLLPYPESIVLLPCCSCTDILLLLSLGSISKLSVVTMATISILVSWTLSGTFRVICVINIYMQSIKTSTVSVRNYYSLKLKRYVSNETYNVIGVFLLFSFHRNRKCHHFSADGVHFMFYLVIVTYSCVIGFL